MLVPLTVKGRAYALGLRSIARIKGAIKNNPALWGTIKRIRAGVRGKPQPVDDE